ncbi:MAG: aldose epimerase family protein [Candidatus Latescibacteria bacterium]|jgi:aldose 1-epimerase|nr:aldose epimerase family protein [Candidatus Latescibacterota bacterium]
MKINQDIFGKIDSGQSITRFTLTSDTGSSVQLISLGAAVTTLSVPDRNGKIGDVVLGYDTLSGYENDTAYFGAIVGRYGNRIARGKFTLNNSEYILATNNEKNHLHGGIYGFDKVVWQTEIIDDSIQFTYTSSDGEEGYPGTLTATVAYTFTDQNELKITYGATTDKATPVNLTHHGYFNLSENNHILNHELTLKATHFTPVDAGLIPTGEIRPVSQTPMDFTTSTPIGTRIDANDEQLQYGGGYDHNWVIDNRNGSLQQIATVHDPQSGRTMHVSTTEPGVQFYSGNFLDGTVIGKNGVAYPLRSGFCLETQHFPDSPNKPAFPSTILNPGETYQSKTVYTFLAK